MLLKKPIHVYCRNFMTRRQVKKKKNYLENSSINILVYTCRQRMLPTIKPSASAPPPATNSAL